MGHLYLAVGNRGTWPGMRQWRALSLSLPTPSLCARGQSCRPEKVDGMGHEIQHRVLHLGAREQQRWGAPSGMGMGLRSAAPRLAAGLHQGPPRA